jgi:hypothetical protein
MKDGKNRKWLLNSYFSEIRNILTIYIFYIARNYCKKKKPGIFPAAPKCRFYRTPNVGYNNIKLLYKGHSLKARRK